MSGYNAREIYEMAEAMEANGEKFYRHAAKVAGDPATRRQMLELADWEAQHRETFAAMRNELIEADAAQVVFDPDSEAAMYLSAMVAGEVFDVNEDPEKYFKADTTLAQLLRTAITLEKDSITFYLGMKHLAGARQGAKLDGIIKEEMGHIALLNQKLMEVAGS